MLTLIHIASHQSHSVAKFYSCQTHVYTLCKMWKVHVKVGVKRTKPGVYVSKSRIYKPIHVRRFNSTNELRPLLSRKIRSGKEFSPKLRKLKGIVLILHSGANINLVLDKRLLGKVNPSDKNISGASGTVEYNEIGE